MAGLEGDIAWTNESGNNDGGLGDFFVTDTLNWTAALTGHFGYDMGGFMPYVLGGVAFANNTLTDTPALEANLVGDPANSTTNTHIGYTVGAGIEAMLAPHLSAFAEARYADYGTKLYGDENADTGAALGPVSLTDASLRTGLNFHF